ncbi:MAG: hypothetical protein LBM65_07920 [Oscillospiraceae bacterium]|nr:hypothetical protein [Oscillospiraceae bacterium]
MTSKKLLAIILATVLAFSLFAISVSAATSTATIQETAEKLLYRSGSGYNLQSYYDCGSQFPYDDARTWANVTVNSNTTNNNSVAIRCVDADNNTSTTNGTLLRIDDGSSKGSENVDYYPNGVDYMTGYARAHHNGGANKTELTII